MDLDEPANGRFDESDQQLAEFLDENHIDAIPSSFGFYYQPLFTSGSGHKTAAGDFVSVYYTIRLTNGTLIDSLVTGAPLRFRHTSTDLAPVGIDLGLTLMEKGDRYRFYIPSYLAYYDHRVDDLMPSYSNIIADVSLVDITDSAGQVAFELSGIALAKGPALEQFETEADVFFCLTVNSPEGSQAQLNRKAKISYKRRLLNGTFAGQGTESFVVGAHPAKGLNEAVRKMRVGETATVIIPSHKAYWNKALMKTGYLTTAMVIPSSFAPEIVAPPFSTLSYEVQLLATD